VVAISPHAIIFIETTSLGSHPLLLFLIFTLNEVDVIFEFIWGCLIIE